VILESGIASDALGDLDGNNIEAVCHRPPQD
jgi:hypothetical protein